MIAAIKTQESRTEAPANNAAFLAMLPAIRRSAQISFRKVRPELRGELIEEVVANCYVAYVRLIERGQADRALPSPLARFAIAQVRAGRRVGNRLRISDDVIILRPVPASSSSLSRSTSTTRKKSAGSRSSSKTSERRRPTLQPAGSTSPNGCGG